MGNERDSAVKDNVCFLFLAATVIIIISSSTIIIIHPSTKGADIAHCLDTLVEGVCPVCTFNARQTVVVVVGMPHTGEAIARIRLVLHCSSSIAAVLIAHAMCLSVSDYVS